MMQDLWTDYLDSNSLRHSYENVKNQPLFKSVIYDIHKPLRHSETLVYSNKAQPCALYAMSTTSSYFIVDRVNIFNSSL